jgi:sterol desaturase/sphingolipid hydroxylase (fatty acid hydroxylase superfamily)
MYLRAARGPRTHCPQEEEIRPAWLLLKSSRRKNMLWTIFVILVVLWLLGMVTSYTLGGFIHVLLVIAIVVVLIQVIQGRRVG